MYTDPSVLHSMGGLFLYQAVIIMAREKQMQAFMLFRETALILTFLSNEDAGKVIKAASRFFLTGEVVELGGDLDTVLEQAIAGVNKSAAAYEAKVRAGAKGGNAHWHKEQ